MLPVLRLCYIRSREKNDHKISQKLTRIRKPEFSFKKKILNKYFKARTKSQLKLHHIQAIQLNFRPWKTPRWSDTARNVSFLFVESFTRSAYYCILYMHLSALNTLKSFKNSSSCHFLVFFVIDPFINFDVQPVTCSMQFFEQEP